MKKNAKTFFILLLVLSMSVSVFTGCSVGNKTGGGEEPPSAGSTIPVAFTNTYDDLYTALSLAMTSGGEAGVRTFGPSDTAASEAVAADGQTALAPTASKDEGGSSDYSKTNVQIEGIDEGDIVKTDGSYIYILHDNELIIMEAEGADTKTVYRATIAEQVERTTDDAYYSSSEYPSELYISGNYLAVISSYSDYIAYETYEEDMKLPYEDTSKVNLDIYDVSDPSNPRLLHELGQDGTNLTSRFVDDTLYLISNYHVYDVTEGDPETFVPSLYRDGVSTLVAEDCIGIIPNITSTAYTVISAYNLPTGTLTANQTVLGGGSTVYMNFDSLYVANATYTETESAPYTDSVYTVVDYTEKNITNISRFDLAGGGVSLTATGTVDGYLTDQFAMDESDGYLRIVTTAFENKWSVYTDEAKDWDFYDWENEESVTTNALYVLNSGMEIVGSITDLAPDETVYSVRFDGDIAYFVTFRTIDPLFAVDLSQPTTPTVLSSLKIAGFSEYLHVYGDGRLFGLGMDADEDSGRTNGMKLTMFDTTDPANVTEKHTLLLDSDYSTALYNHKAILVSAENDLIAFPVDNGFDVYGYADESGFYLKAQITSDEWYGNARGLYIGDFVYIIDASGVSVLNMNDFTQATKITF